VCHCCPQTALFQQFNGHVKQYGSVRISLFSSAIENSQQPQYNCECAKDKASASVLYRALSAYSRLAPMSRMRVANASASEIVERELSWLSYSVSSSLYFFPYIVLFPNFIPLFFFVTECGQCKRKVPTCCFVLYSALFSKSHSFTINIIGM
jgi:hypothetical protein